ncbi:hypothetical protein BSF38_04759 [Paludisphaera borealis]|uniref:Uncharacterized protein n=1 Tax=Paludisphaera borealis TaxID=1387353 RepID=A0A1U7CWB5_9BACT|nr:hypothetical protein BSF38_04759 [Paludisphaera borealis]
MSRYVEQWDEPVTAFMEPTDHSGANLDEEEIDPASLPFQLTVGSLIDSYVGRHLANRRLVLGCHSHRQNHLARLSGTPGALSFISYIAENAVKSRIQMARSTSKNFVVALRRHWWELGQERRHRAAIRQATGVR